MNIDKIASITYGFMSICYATASIVLELLEFHSKGDKLEVKVSHGQQ